MGEMMLYLEDSCWDDVISQGFLCEDCKQIVVLAAADVTPSSPVFCACRLPQKHGNV